MTTLAPVNITLKLPRVTKRGMTPYDEEWAAETTDGEWSFERAEVRRTPWWVFHRPSLDDGSLPVPLTWLPTREACQEFVGSGDAARELEKAKAEWAAKMAGVA